MQPWTNIRYNGESTLGNLRPDQRDGPLAQACLLVCCLLFIYGFASAQGAEGSAGAKANVEPRFLIDTPTAGILHSGDFALDIDFFADGGMTVGLSAGLINRLNLGISYGGTHFIGSEKAEFNEVPGVSLRYRVLDETLPMPALVFGFDSQGREEYIDSLDRYTIKSPGFFAAASKNYRVLGNLSVHGGLNYSLERGDDDKDLNFFGGAEKTVGRDISLVAEYDFAFNDSNRRAVGRGRGYLNVGVRWSVSGGFTIGLDFKNLIKNRDQVDVGNRTLRIEFVGRL